TVLEVPELLIVADEGSWRDGGQLENRATEEIIVAVGTKDIEDRRRQIDLAHRGREFSGLEELWRVEDDRNPIAADGQLGLASGRGAVVGDDDEQCLVEPRL